MELLDKEIIPFTSVIEIYKRDHGQKNDSWELKNLERADKHFKFWMYANIPSSNIGEIVLPHYRHGGCFITPESGATVKEAYINFIKKRKHFETHNPQFCKRIESQVEYLSNQKEVKSLFLSEEPLMRGLSYGGLQKFKNRITHLDGFHRLVALMHIKEKPEFIGACIATYENSRLLK